MHSVWTPAKKPPVCISEFSTEAAKVWDAICKLDAKHTKSQHKDIQTGSSYYESLYAKAFKCRPPSNLLSSSSTQTRSQSCTPESNLSNHRQIRSFRNISSFSGVSESFNGYQLQAEETWTGITIDGNKESGHSQSLLAISKQNDMATNKRQCQSNEMFKFQITNTDGSSSGCADGQVATFILSDSFLREAGDTSETGSDPSWYERLTDEKNPPPTCCPKPAAKTKPIQPRRLLFTESSEDPDYHSNPKSSKSIRENFARVTNAGEDIQTDQEKLDDDDILDDLGSTFKGHQGSVVDSRNFGMESPPLDFDDDVVLSQLPKLPILGGKNTKAVVDPEGVRELEKTVIKNIINQKSCDDSVSSAVGSQSISQQLCSKGNTQRWSYLTGDNHEQDRLKTGYPESDTNGLLKEEERILNDPTNNKDEISHGDVINYFEFNSNEQNTCWTGTHQIDYLPSSDLNKHQSSTVDPHHRIRTHCTLSVDDDKDIKTVNNSVIGQNTGIIVPSDTTRGNPALSNNNNYNLTSGRSECRSTKSTLSSKLRELKNRKNIPQEKARLQSKEKRQQQIKKFTVPLKRQKGVEQACLGSDDKDKRSPRIQSMEELSDSERHRLADILLTVDEVAMALAYNDGSSQLREVIDSKKKNRTAEFKEKIASVVIAYEVTAKATGLQYVSFSLPDRSSYLPEKTDQHLQWKRSVVDRLMTSKTRTFVFGGQQLIETLLVAFSFNSSQVLTWTVLDAKIASWLLDPEESPATFMNILTKTACLPENWEESDICDGLRLLGSVMIHLCKELESRQLWMLYIKVEMPLVPILACMQQRGFIVNVSAMMEAGQWMEKKLKQLEKQAFQVAGHPFLINSHTQLRQVLFDELRLDARLPAKYKIARTPTNRHKSTSEAVLKQLAAVHRLPQIIIEYRQVQKIKSTYVDGMLSCIEDGILYTHWDHTAAVTGRLTSVNPNLQAVPKQPLVIHGVRDNFIAGKEDEPVKISPREPFIARQGWSFIAADFQQIELRIFAHISEDINLRAIFCQTTDTDIFIKLASQWLGKCQAEISTSDREQTKRIVYSVMYGAGKERLADYLETSPDEAKAIIDNFLAKFPAISSFTKKCVAEARQKGYQRTILGRRRWFPQINHPNPSIRSQAERQAVNFCIQGSAADLCKVAMIEVERALANKDRLRARILIQIHDELLLEVPDEEITEVTDLLRVILENGDLLCASDTTLTVPVRVNFTSGKSWGLMHACH